MPENSFDARPRPNKRLVVVVVMALVVLLIGGYLAYLNQADPSRTGPNGERIFEVELTGQGSDLGVSPSSITVDPGDHLVVDVTNTTDGTHDLKLDGTIGTPMLQPDQMATADFGVIQSSTSAWCTVPGHREAGMEMEIKVSGQQRP